MPIILTSSLIFKVILHRSNTSLNFSKLQESPACQQGQPLLCLKGKDTEGPGLK